MSKILVFAGTTEGRKLLEALSRSIGESGLSVFACVATDYGKYMLPTGLKHVTVHAGRMTEAEMTDLMKKHQFDFVIDTTHPYARLVSDNIRKACEQAGCSYIRLLRASGIERNMEDSNCLFFDSHEAAAAYLGQNPGNALMTIGSKELHKYTKVTDYQQRLFPRVLPMAEVMEHCALLGFKGKQLILMQGPFTAELNAAMIRQIRARYLVTKDSGETGGFPEKYQAALQTGIVLLVIGREAEEDGITPDELADFLEKTYGIKLKGQTEAGRWFPFFTNITEKEFLVIGAGKIAKRRIETLLKFDCRIRVVAPEALTEVKGYHEEKRLELQLRPYESDDICGADYVLAATNDKEINHQIYLECKTRKIPVNVADCKEKSDFYFPGIIRENGLTVGVTAEGKNHALAKNATQAIGRLLNSVFPGAEQEEIKWNGEK